MAFVAMPFGSPSFAARSNSTVSTPALQVGGDLRAHDTGAEHRGPAYKQFLRHVVSL